MKEQEDTLKNYYFIAGQVMFVVGENQDQGCVTVNAVVTQDSDLITQTTLARAEIGIRNQFLTKLEDQAAQVKIIDIVFLGITPMGNMLREQFLDRKLPTKEELSAEMKQAGVLKA